VVLFPACLEATYPIDRRMIKKMTTMVQSIGCKIIV